LIQKTKEAVLGRLFRLEAVLPGGVEWHSPSWLAFQGKLVILLKQEQAGIREELPDTEPRITFEM